MDVRISMSSLYPVFRYGYPHSLEEALKSLPEIRSLGFRFYEMEGVGSQLLRSLYESRERVLKTVEDCGLHVHNFCVVDPDLASPAGSKRTRSLDLFKMGAELAEMLGAETLLIASYAPPVKYLEGKPYQLGGTGGYHFANGARIRLPNSFNWNLVWDTLVRACQDCADVAAQHGKVLLMEPRVGEIICSVDSLLRLIADVGRPNFKANFDTAHLCAQRENVVLALAKLRGHFANIHVADNIPVNTEHLPIGDGVIDWKEFFRVLKIMKYGGYLGLDLGMRKSLVQGYRKSVERILAIASELKLRIEV